MINDSLIQTLEKASYHKPGSNTRGLDLDQVIGLVRAHIQPVPVSRGHENYSDDAIVLDPPYGSSDQPVGLPDIRGLCSELWAMAQGPSSIEEKEDIMEARLLAYIKAPKRESGIEATPLNRNALVPFKGWRFIYDENGVAHHVPNHETLDEMCKVYYGRATIDTMNTGIEDEAGK